MSEDVISRCIVGDASYASRCCIIGGENTSVVGTWRKRRYCSVLYLLYDIS